MEKDNSVSSLGCTSKINAARGLLTHVKELVTSRVAREKERVVPLNERFLMTRNAKNVHERHIEDEEDEERNGGADNSSYLEFDGNVHQSSACEEYDADFRALGLNFDVVNTKELYSLPAIEVTNNPIIMGASAGYYSEGDSVSNDGVNGGDGDGQNKSSSSSENLSGTPYGYSSSGNLSGTPYGYPYRYR